MIAYKNVSGDSKVARYHAAKDALTVRFTDHSVYLYTNQSVSPEEIAKMKSLAEAGKGLGTYIAANAKDRWARKVR